MIYLIEYSKLFKKQLRKLDNSTREIIIKKIYNLRENPTFYGKLVKKDFYELKHKGFRIYYKVLHGVIIINNIKYKGKIKLERIGNKNTQRNDIEKLV